MKRSSILLNNFRKRMAQTGDSEPEQAIKIRLSIGLIVILYFCLPWGHFHPYFFLTSQPHNTDFLPWSHGDCCRYIAKPSSITSTTNCRDVPGSGLALNPDVLRCRRQHFYVYHLSVGDSGKWLSLRH